MPNVMTRPTSRVSPRLVTILTLASYLCHAATYYGETLTTDNDVDCITTTSSQLYYCTGKKSIASYPLSGGSITSLTTALRDPDGAAYLPAANVLLVTESRGIQLYTISTAVFTKIAGGSTGGTVDGVGTAARMGQPSGILVTPDESVAYFVDATQCVLRQMSVSGFNIVTVAGVAASCNFLDGTGVAAKFDKPRGLAFGANEASLIVADGGNDRLRSVTLPGYIVTTFACSGTRGSSDGLALSATCDNPSAVVRIASSDIIYFVDQGTSILRRLSAGTITTVLGTAGTTGTTDGYGAAGRLKNPLSLTADLNGYLYIGQKGGAGARIVRVTITDTTTTSVPTTTTAAPTTVASTPTTTTQVSNVVTNTTAPTAGTGPLSTTESPPASEITTLPDSTIATPSSTTEPATTTTAQQTTMEPPSTTQAFQTTTTAYPPTTVIDSSVAISTTNEAPATTSAPTGTSVETSYSSVPTTSPAATTTILTTAPSDASTPQLLPSSSASSTSSAPLSTASPIPTELISVEPTAVTDAPTVPAPTDAKPSTLEPLPPTATDQVGTDTTPAVTGTLTLKINVETARARAPELREAIAESAQVTVEAVTILAILPGSAVVQFEIKTKRDPATVSDGMSTSIQSGGALAAFAPVVATLTLQRKPGDALFAVGVAFYSCIGLAIIALVASIGWSLYRRRHPDLVMKVKPTAEVRSGAIYVDVSPDGKARVGSGDLEAEEKVELLRVGPGLNPDSTRGIRVIKLLDSSFAVSNFDEKHGCDLVIDMDSRISPQGSLSDDEEGQKLSPPARETGTPQIVTGPGFRRNRSRRRFQGFTASMLPPLAPRAVPAAQPSGFDMLQRLQPSREVINGDLAAGYAMN
jgi:hypothetical protein